MSLQEHYPDSVLDVGSGVTLRFTQRSGEVGYCGAILEHPAVPGGPHDADGRCSGAIWFKGYGQGHPEWTIEGEQPLTCSPSFLCHCGFHGFIRNGQWVQA